ncbi:putative zinc-type alcohol dehydrogenase-like protein [Lachnellula hyalina]|uniref:Putative zinc-type alcohol dehydrogenase-like protein n=1 Tax=Lachnellula hyalina TaxID=1316788 RepID=A0A8H8R0Q1_9HELO|nr:putative zinc-type alcohol dehydrogenase-like protein [Lachnellula hyalina]TVY24769.1 putative zinc-type alcohol dehydrogenase-like protein [Lachnellula hyalina]
MPKAITMKQVEGKPGKVYYPTKQPTETYNVHQPPASNRPHAHPGPQRPPHNHLRRALNHRDFFLRQHLYPAPSFTTPILADGCGTVTATGSSATSWLHKRVILAPGQGWASSPTGPESPSGYAILGGTSSNPLGTLQEVVCVDQSEVEVAPEHLSDVQAAALPLTGLTGWRALVTKSGNAEAGRNILVTGIGGGVALNVLQFAVAAGSNVWVTSGSREKIERAVEVGARGGVSYKEKGWEKELRGLLPVDRPWPGGVIVQYGMTVGPKMDWTMGANLMNLELKGTTMGSRKEFKDMVAFVKEKKIRPIVSKVAKGLDNLKDIDELFEQMRNGSQFGKLVVEVVPSQGGNSSSKL